MNIFETKLKDAFVVDNTMSIYERILTNSSFIYKNVLVINNQNLIINIDRIAHYIKKYNITITFYIEERNQREEFLNKIKDEEYEKNIKVTDTLILDNIFDLVIIFKIENKKRLNIILHSIINIIDNNSFIYIYCTLCTKDENIEKKSKIRDALKNITKLNISTLIYYDDFIKLINQHENIKIYSTSLFKVTDYILYGTNKLYEFILTSDS